MFTRFAHLDFDLPCCLVLCLRVCRSYRYDVYYTRVGELPLEFEVVSPPIHTISFGAPYLKTKSWFSPRLVNTHTTGSGGSRSCRWWLLLNAKDAPTAIVCAVRRSIYFQSGFSSVSPRIPNVVLIAFFYYWLIAKWSVVDFQSSNTLADTLIVGAIEFM
jgi:hypothetical protein